jgi:hypothetical protein
LALFLAALLVPVKLPALLLSPANVLLLFGRTRGVLSAPLM